MSFQTKLRTGLVLASAISVSSIVLAQIPNFRGHLAKVIVKIVEPNLIQIQMRIWNPSNNPITVNICREDQLCTYSVRFEQRRKGAWRRVESNENVVLGDFPPKGQRRYSPSTYSDEKFVFRPSLLALYDNTDTRIVILGSVETPNGVQKIEIPTETFRLPTP